jgi:GNAT superfamily N-acetyltransferase
MDYALRSATSADAGFVQELEEICMRAYAEVLWASWIPSIARYGFDPSRHRVVQIDGKDVGCIDVWREADHLLLDKLYLLPEARGQGIGASLLNLVLSEAQAARMPLRLSVLTSNPRALTFYLREGFREIDRTPERILLEAPS